MAVMPILCRLFAGAALLVPPFYRRLRFWCRLFTGADAFGAAFLQGDTLEFDPYLARDGHIVETRGLFYGNPHAIPDKKQ